jgi:Tfp pilus assembly protein PilX
MPQGPAFDQTTGAALVITLMVLIALTIVGLPPSTQVLSAENHPQRERNREALAEAAAKAVTPPFRRRI